MILLTVEAGIVAHEVNHEVGGTGQPLDEGVMLVVVALRGNRSQGAALATAARAATERREYMVDQTSV